jgi:DNA-binding phage protein
MTMKKTTTELLSIMKHSTNISNYLESVSDDFIEKMPLCNYLSDILEEKNIKKSAVIQKSGLDRGYCYDIFSGSKTPSRDKVLAICFALELSPAEVQQLLKYTEYPQLYAKIERDSVILFALEHKLSLSEVNELLYEMKLDLLQ